MPRQCNHRSSAAKFISCYGAYIVGFIGALAALIFAYFIHSHRDLFLCASFVLFFWNIFWTEKGVKWGGRLVGMMSAGVCILASLYMPEYAKDLLCVSGFVAGMSLFAHDIL